MESILTTKHGVPTSPQVSCLMDIPDSAKAQPATPWEPGFVFLLKVCGSEAVQCRVLPASGDKWVKTIMAAGWNPELIKGFYVDDPSTTIEDNVYQAGW